jgi:hypothetical protein
MNPFENEENHIFEEPLDYSEELRVLKNKIV